jgi:hypothetical protein
MGFYKVKRMKDENSPKIKTLKPVDYSGLLYFFLIAIVSTALWLNIPIPYDISWIYVPSLYFVLFTPFYVLVLAISLAYLKIKSDRIASNQRREEGILSKVMLFTGYFIILVSIFIIIKIFFPLFYIGVKAIAGLEIPVDMDTIELFVFLIIKNPWFLFSFIINCLFHIPRLIQLFKFVSMTEEEIETLNKKSKTSFSSMASKINTCLKPVFAVILTLFLGIFAFLLIPILLPWVYWSYASKKKNKAIEEDLPWSDTLLGLAILLVSFFAVFWIYSTLQVTVLSFFPFATIYALINIKFLLDEAGVKLELS